MYLHSTQVSLSLWCLLLIFKIFKKFWKSIYSVCFDGTEKINYFSFQIFLLIMSSYSYWVPQQGHCCDEAGGCKQVTGKRDWVKSRIPSGLLGSNLRERRWQRAGIGFHENYTTTDLALWSLYRSPYPDVPQTAFLCYNSCLSGEKALSSF